MNLAAEKNRTLKFLCFLAYMPNKKQPLGPPIAANPAHARFVALFSPLSLRERENFFVRVTGESHQAAKLMREIAYWFLPSKQDPTRPRVQIFHYKTDQRYWLCRSREEWKKEIRFTRRVLEGCYRRCENFLDRGYFMFKAQRRTHYALRFDKLCVLLENDPEVREALELETAENRRPVGAGTSRPDGSETDQPVGTQTALPSLTLSSGNAVGTTNNTGCAGPAAPVVVVEPSAPGATAPEPPPPARLVEVEQELEEIENPPELSNQQIHVLLKQAEGKTLSQKSQVLRTLVPFHRKVVGYLLIWQRAFEREYPGRKHHFNDGHLRAARELASQGVSLGTFQDALDAAWEVRGVSEGRDPLFMCRNHSRKFGLFCKHFTRMEDELVQEGEL